MVTTQVRPEHGAENVPDAPDAGAVKVTWWFGIGWFAGLVSRATSGAPNGLLMIVDCGLPEIAASVRPPPVP